MRPAAALALLSMTALAAVPSQAAPVTTLVTGAGTGVATLGGCQAEVAIAFHLTFGIGESPVLFPNPGCEGWANAWVNDCRQVAAGILCDGSYEDEGFLSITHEGVFHFERPASDGTPFAVDGQVAFNQAVGPSL